MFNERAFIARVEEAGPEELARLLTHPSVDEEKALRAHLGDRRYQRMHGMALKRNISRSVGRAKKGSVVVIHGIMGAELSVSSGSGAGDLTWVNAFRIVRGWLDRLRLKEDGRAEFGDRFQVRASGIMKRYYGELILSLAENWDVQAFWFDWRKDLNLAADALNARIGECFGDRPVHIVAHSMGGLAARTFIMNYPDRWRKMGESPGLREGGRLVMLGTPNHGSFAIPQVLTGLEGLVRKLALLDLRHNTRELLDVFNSFVGSYQMLPSPFVADADALYEPATYTRLNVPISPAHLANAREHHRRLQTVVDAGRMVYVAGFDQPTFDGVVKDGAGRYALGDADGYTMTRDGDGRVPHRLGFLDRDGRRLFPAYFIREDHGNLSSNAAILKALDELLETGATDDLYDDLAQAKAAAGVSRAAVSADELRREFLRQQEEDEARLRVSLRRMDNSRGAAAGTRPETDEERVAETDAARKAETVQDEKTREYISPEERKVEEAVTRGFLSYRGEDEDSADDSAGYDHLIESGSVELGLVYGGIESFDYDATLTAEGRPVDAVAVGHYIGVRPVAAEQALDEAISRELRGAGDAAAGNDQGILTEYTERGVIHGKLGQPFFMPDPRDRRGAAAGRTRLVVLAGMGEPGRFGAPELTVLVRELCWSLGRMQCRHLATVLIGTGAGNLEPRQALSAWVGGIRRALTSSIANEGRSLDRITFVENNPSRYLDLDELLVKEKERRAGLGFTIDYTPLTAEQRRAAHADERRRARAHLNAQWKRRAERREGGAAGGPQDWRTPTRVTLGLDAARKVYRFGAITDHASVPEREVAIDPAVVMQANDELAGEQSPAMQVERGRLLEALLMPDDLRASLNNNAPLVMLLDATTARIHWEMVAQPALIASPVAGAAAPPDGDARAFDPMRFLGTARGFTRQLRTTFAPPPEPPPPPKRVLRVLVVADPAEDAHLPGAQEEGVAVADLFESFNSVYKEKLGVTRVEVKRLFGPLEATRTNVLRELMLRSYDVLHFAGHCVYRWDADPTLSGWIFNAARRELLTANELTRIDRIPKFVFSNACESGITPDRSRERSAELAPSFAEAFFARGVANFVCTAWPVDDAAARVFALTLYSELLGIKLDRAALGLPEGVGGDGEPADADPGGAKTETAKRQQQNARRQKPVPMYEAMRDARTRIASLTSGRLTWGAYQHYGNPYFQFFTDLAQTPAPAPRKAAAGRAATKEGAAKKGAAKRTGAKKTGARK